MTAMPQLCSAPSRVPANRAPVPLFGVLPGDPDAGLEQDLGDPRQLVADLHQRKAAREVRDRDAKHRGTLEIAQRVHESFEVPRVLAREPFLELGGQLMPPGRRLHDARIDQVVEQEGMDGDLAGQELAAAAQEHEALRARPGSRSAAQNRRCARRWR
jgi:hypothetical protein